MVLVILGTQDKEFPRLLEAVEREIKNKTIMEEVIVQAGQTKYSSRRMKIFDFIARDEFQEYIEESSYVITHGGVGSIIESLNASKKVVAIPRLQRYGEHENDHQLQIVNEFVERGYVLTCEDLNDLGTVIKKIPTFQPSQYQSNQESFLKLVKNYIENW